MGPRAYHEPPAAPRLGDLTSFVAGLVPATYVVLTAIACMPGWVYIMTNRRNGTLYIASASWTDLLADMASSGWSLPNVLRICARQGNANRISSIGRAPGRCA